MHAVPKMGPLGGPILGPCLGSFFEVFCIRVAEAQSFGFNETLWLMATGRATVPNLYAGCLSKPNCNFVFVARVGLCCGFCDFASAFLLSFTTLCMRSQKWDKPQFFEVFVSGLQKRKVLVSMKLCGLWQPEGQLFPNLYAGCLSKPNCNFVFVARVGLCCGFCDFCGLIFGTARRSQKWDRESAFLLFFTTLCMQSQKWDR